MMEIDTGLIFRMALETTTHAAPVAAVAGGVEPVATRHQGREVAYHGGQCVLLAEDMVVKSTLVVVGNLRVGLIREETVGQLQQVIRTAVLTVVAREVLRLCLGLEKVLFVGDFARHEGMVVDQCII